MKTKPNYNRNYKVKKFKLSEEEKVLLSASDESLKSMVVSELQKQINALLERLEKMKNQEPQSGTTKKSVIQKLKRFKKELTDDECIKRRVNMLKLRKRKLKALNSKVEVKLDKIKLSKVRCLKCKKRGHLASDCKFSNTEEKGDDSDAKEKIGTTQDSKKTTTTTAANVKKILCYNCGSSEHNLYSCSLPVNYANLPFAECFICNQNGHISSNCPKSDKGIYIRGGSCFTCNAKDHLAKNCPQKQIQNPRESSSQPKVLTRKPPMKPTKKKFIKNKKI